MDLALSKQDLDRFMGEAIAEAEAAAQKGDVPVGAVVVKDGQIIVRGHNRKEELKDPIAHAEVNVISETARLLGRWRLNDVVLVVTKEPCPMCAGAIVQARIPLLVYGVDDPKNGAAGSVFDIVRSPRMNHQAQVISGIRSVEIEAMLTKFFRELR